MSKYPTPRRWAPKYPQKYDGDISKIISRSSWELKFMNWCDNNTAVLSWSSEETVVPYRSPVDMEPHRYFLDFKIKVNSSDGIKTYLVEIKPSAQRVPPKIPKRKSRSYLTECSVFMVNQAKWAAASRWANDRGWEFIVLDEFDLGIQKRK